MEFSFFISLVIVMTKTYDLTPLKYLETWEPTVFFKGVSNDP